MNTTSLSRKLLIATLALFVLALFQMAGPINRIFALVPVQVVDGLQLWRLMTYPVGVEFLGLIVASIGFGAPGEEIEQMLGTKGFGGILLLSTLIIGLIHLLLFLGSDVYLAGPVNLGFMVLVGFVYLFPDSEIRLLFFTVRSWVVLTIATGVTVALATLAVFGGSSPLLFLSMGGFGLLGGLAYFHIRYQKYPVLLRPIRTVERIVAGNRHPQVSGTANGSRSATAPVQNRLRMPFQKPVPREVSDEERLNQILDRINEQSYSSLSDEEKRFLREYSSRL